MSGKDLLDALPPVSEAEVDGPDAIAALLAAGQPVVLRNLVAHWDVLTAARSPAELNAYLKRMDRGLPVPVMEAPAAGGGRFGYTKDLREFSFTKRQRPLAETLDRIERGLDDPQAPFVAIQLLALDDLLPDFRIANPMPLVPAGASPRLWLGGAVRTQIHNDRDHNLACVVAGHRRFLLFPPEQVGNLYIGPIENPPPLSLVDPEAPDPARFPRFAEALAHARTAELAPGDALLMPRHWWHHVTSRDRYNAMVNYWWGEAPVGLENPADCFLTALLALHDLPQGERRYWQAMFETYVFADDGAAHIPQSLRGVLGPLRGERRRALKQRLRATVIRS